jgi:hypothetical protein
MPRCYLVLLSLTQSNEEKNYQKIAMHKHLIKTLLSTGNYYAFRSSTLTYISLALSNVPKAKITTRTQI